MSKSARLDFPSTGRNAEPILEVLKTLLPAEGLVVEVASGSGQHAARFALEFPDLIWQPTDKDPDHRRSIVAGSEGLCNVLKPLDLDTTASDWPAGRANAVICINMIHIAPWSAGLGLLAGAGRILEPGEALYLYGPYMIDGAHTSESNARFDADLKSRHPSWGLRNLADVVSAALDAELKLDRTVEMPANNLSVIFRKSA